jgi:RNA polymerase sigma-70 factor (ECF subfamily)
MRTTFLDTDLEAVRLAQAGDVRGFEKLYRKYVDPLYRFCAWQTNHSHDTDDLVHDIFVAVTRSLHTFQGRTTFQQWLFVIARNIINQWLRKKYQLPSRSLAEHDHDLAAVIVDEDARWIAPENTQLKRQLVRQLLQQLKPLEQRALTLRYAQGHSVQETAKRLHKTPNAIKVLIHRAKTKLQHLPKLKL